MRVDVQQFSTPKSGNTAEEYEDAFWPREPVRGDVPTLSIAVADGATEALYSGEWARLLVETYCLDYFNPQRINESLEEPQEAWRKHVGEKPVPWYAEEGIRRGAFASLLGLTITPDEKAGSGHWECLAVGDSCMFHVRNGQLVQAFPLSRAEEFNSRPTLLASVPARNAGVEGALRIVGGRWEIGDAFYLMTDALAAWLLHRLETLSDDSSSDVFEWIDSFKDEAKFLEFIALERGEKRADGTPKMRNDDVTLVRCLVGRSQSGGEDGVADRG